MPKVEVPSKEVGMPPRKAVQRAKARLLQTLNRDGSLEEKEFSSRPAELAHRALPSLKFIIDSIPKQSRVFDLGSGRGRHTFVALEAGHRVVAVDRKPSICEGLRKDLLTLGPDGRRAEVVEGDFLNITASEFGAADLVIVTGVLQHARTREELLRRLKHIADLACHPTSLIYVEMLFDMIFDGIPPQDGRIRTAPGEFVEVLRDAFPRERWYLERTHGPVRQKQVFDESGRSFEPPARVIESTAVEYVIRRIN
jgi:SAM-dependent methyltransferase